MKKNILVTRASRNLEEAFLEGVDFGKYTINAAVREIKKKINYHTVDLNDVKNTHNFIENSLKSDLK